jgi:transcriptional regulator
MYKMPYFTETDEEKVLSFMQSHPFVTLIGNDGQSSVATQVPVLVSGGSGAEIKLRGHIMRKTDHHRAFERNNAALVLFTGPQCYVSSGWYSEQGHGATWNYMTVHARGTLHFLDDAGTISILTDLTQLMEANEERPYLVRDLSDEYVRSNVKAIAGFEIVLDTLHPVFKLSQNRDDESYRNIVKRLETSSDYNAREIATVMKQRRPQLFDR